MFLATSSTSGWLSYRPDECCIGSPTWSKVWVMPHVCISVCSCLPWVSQDVQNLSWWLWKDHRGCEPAGMLAKTPRWWRKSVGDSPPNNTWVFLANCHSSWNELSRFLIGGKKAYASKTLSGINATFSIDYSCDFRQVTYLFLAPFTDKIITKFAYDLSPSKVEVSQEHLNWSQWICKDVKTGEIIVIDYKSA